MITNGQTGNAPTRVSLAGAGGEGGRMARLQAPGEEGAFPFAGGGYSPGAVSTPTYYAPNYAAGYPVPQYDVGAGYYPSYGSDGVPPPPVPPNSGGGLNTLTNLLSNANTIRKLPEYYENIKDFFNPAQVTTAGSSSAGMGGGGPGFQGHPGLGIPASTAGTTSAGMGGGLNTPVIGHPGMGLGAGIGLGSTAGAASAGMGGGGLAFTGHAGLGATTAATTGVTTAGATTAGATTAGAGGFGGAATMGPAAVLAAIGIYSGMADARKREEATKRYEEQFANAERSDLGGTLQGFEGNNGRYYLEMNRNKRTGDYGDFSANRYLDQALAGGPIKALQYTGDYSMGTAGAGRTAVELRGYDDVGSLEEHLKKFVTPASTFADTAPIFGGHDIGQAGQQKWMAQHLPGILGGGKRYATNMKDGARMDLTGGQKAPSGYDLAPNNGFGYDAPKLPTAQSMRPQQSAGTQVIGGGQGGSIVSAKRGGASTVSAKPKKSAAVGMLSEENRGT